ncbi:hypothetical protein BKP45_05680 [Anaerobacillus alkalidiazotrophicus]|uniref:LysM domain-containing protein n=1 Tax=Anaerobacillus alkalidiazotrophicus TaxID=472963 RepID=A0A1S2MC65_9BACI|nr:hypothetical protein [Anaerobacillus alkalidiazotrophicus]OIJ22164.1 hypothetical protein BKP45_05680 [Anaerobacillus alkalidiazotrophicus]
MKKLIAPILLLITIYSIYYDLNIGTLPANTIVAAESTTTVNHSSNISVEKIENIPSESIVVEPGYTVLSIVEELHIGPVNASIQQIINDFETLNPNTNASNIKIGDAYLFPIYPN